MKNKHRHNQFSKANSMKYTRINMFITCLVSLLASECHFQKKFRTINTQQSTTRYHIVFYICVLYGQLNLSFFE